MSNNTEQLQENILSPSIEEILHTSMMSYSQYVILERALPRVEDGLKPVQRRILYTLHELLITPDKPHRKCARIVGDCLGKYHPHGDSSVYDAMVRMAQPFSMRGLLVDGHGNFGSVDGDSPAAMRYTEARMAPLAQEMLRDIQKDTVDFNLNFDDTLKEPAILPSRFPNLLLNGASGIAVGLATNIPPHNLKELIDACLLLIKNENAGLDEIMEIVKGPDFPGGGLLIQSPDIKEAYETGRGRLTLRAKVVIEQGKLGRNLLCITELPYQVNKAKLLEKILELSETKKAQLNSIYDIRDESDRNGMRAVIELKKEADPLIILALLYKWSDLEIKFGVNMVAIADGKPVQLSLKDALVKYIEHQRQVLTRRSKYELEQLSARAHILEGYMIAIDCLDETIQIIRASKNPAEARERLMSRFSFSQVQAQAILDLRLQRLTGLELLALQKEYAEVNKQIAKLKAILESKKKLDSLLGSELLEIKEKYGDDRRTKIVYDTLDVQKAVEESLQEVAEPCVVVLSREGFIKRLSPKNFERLMQDQEPVKLSINAMTDDYLYFFTNIGNVFRLQVSQVEESLRIKDRGISLPGILAGLKADESLASLICLSKSDLEDKAKSLIFYTKQGFIKKSEISEYAINRKNFQGLKLKDSDELLKVDVSSSENDIYFLSRLGMMIRFNQSQVPLMGRTTQGVSAIKLSKEDEVISAGLLEDSATLALFSERGYAKRLPVSHIDAQNRSGKGVRIFAFNKNQSNGSFIAGHVFTNDDSQITVVLKDGEVNQVFASEIMLQSPQDKGKPCVIALLENIVTEVY